MFLETYLTLNFNVLMGTSVSNMAQLLASPKFLVEIISRTFALEKKILGRC